MPLSTGARLGPYEILSPIGAGGMGEVYKARDTRLDRTVAIKVLPESFATDPDRLRRFEHEARAIAALNHPNVCQIHDIGPGYLVLEYVEGEPLHGPIAVEQAVRLALQIASAMEAAHRRGILHRDLKPPNIMVTREGAAKLLDFGLAKLMALPEGGPEDLTRTTEGQVLGTAAYMAPEQAEGQPLDARSDVFSFGAVLYEMLSGSRAFSGQTTAQLLNAVLRADPPPLRTLPALERIVRQCLAKQPSRRFQTMTELKAALEQTAREPASAKPTEQQPSIAVLPFANLSANKENEYFSDGLAEEIINALTHIPGLKVTARTSSFAFRGKEEDIRKIAETLDCRAILEGSVRRSGSRIRVAAQLINAADGYHLWSERYDRELTDVFAVQDEIAAAIGSALQATLAGTRETVRRYTPNLPAYEAYLKGRHQLLKHTAEGLARSQDYFKYACTLDPQYADPHQELGALYVLIAAEGLQPAKRMMPLARAEALEILKIDPTDRRAHSLLCVVASSYDYDWKEADARYRLATAGDVAWSGFPFIGSLYLLAIGRLRQAIVELERSLEADPLHPLNRCILAGLLNISGEPERASDEVRKVLEIDEGQWAAHFSTAWFHTARGMLTDALAAAERAYSLAPWHGRVIGILAGVLTRTGNHARADELLRPLRAAPRSPGNPIAMVVYHLVCSEMDAAADWLETAIEERETMAVWYLRDSLGLQSSPRWRKLAKTMNLPETA